MRLFADECTSGSIITGLEQAGFNIVRATELCASDTDEQVLELAYKDKRILLTEDKEFGELTIRLKLLSVGVIIVMLPNHESNERAERVIKVITNEQNQFIDRMTVIEPNRIRQRSLSA